MACVTVGEAKARKGRRQRGKLATTSEARNEIKIASLLQWPAAYLGPVVAAAGAAIFPLSVTNPDGLATWIKWVTEGYWFWVGLVAIPIGILWSVAGASAHNREAESLRQALVRSRAEATEDVIHRLSPIFHDLGKLAESQKRNIGSDLVNRALSMVTKMIDVPNVRACLYRLDRVESTLADSLDIPNSLNLRTPHEGRFDAPRPNFVRGESAAADEFFEVIDTGISRLVENIDKTEYALDCENRRYRTFLNVPVKYQMYEIGVLSVDAPTEGSLTQSHVLLAEMVAQLLALGVRREQKSIQDRTPAPRNDVGGHDVQSGEQPEGLYDSEDTGLVTGGGQQ